MLALSLVAAPARQAGALNPETLLMPGKLSAAHRKYEETCSSCHDRSNRGRQSALCMDCHKEVAADVRAHQGFHGRLPGIERAACSACHSEHLGREADIVKLSRAQFDHGRTDFPLAGTHAQLGCDSCHAAKQAFRKAPSDCYACHKQDDAHAGALGRDCAACHDAGAFRPARFDHAKTAFALAGRHAEISCAQCHFGNRYKQTPQACNACHAPDDIHNGERGAQCGQCHDARSWKSARFDHARQSGFALEGGHGRIACNACHRTASLKDPLPRDCFGCHRDRDAHQGHFGKDCARCHGSEKWPEVRFDHARDTRWPLAGKHAQVGCKSCHSGDLATQKLPTDCLGCHREDDVHQGRLGEDCAACHAPAGWRAALAFDHDFTDFPLVGMHVAAPCARCHATPQYKDAPKNCYDCHRAEDIHRGSLGQDCGRCHAPNRWRDAEFDHGTETGFALNGAHLKLTCAGCHKQPADKVKLDPACAACHSRDDVHLGQYGRQCQRCHSTATFKGARVH